MKTLSALLLAGLLLLTAPSFTLAHDRAHRSAPPQNYGWVGDRHEQGNYYRHDRKPRWERRAKKHIRRHHRRQRQFARRHYRPHYISAPAVVYPVSQIVFQLGW